MKLTAWEHFPNPVRKAWRIMRITTLLIMVISLHLSAKTTAQKITLSSNNISIEQFFNQLEKQTGYSFLLENGVVSKDEKISVNVKDVSLEIVLDQILKPINLSYKIENKTVYILKSSELLTSGNENLAIMPPIDIHGRVTDSLGNPLAGASVTVRGTKRGTSTDANGNFTLNGVDSKATLIFSFTGYATTEIKLAGRNDITLQLKQASTSLLDVVVSKGYYSTTQRLNTGDVSVVTSKEIEEQPVTDPMLAMEGRVPGLYIQQTSGFPGSYSTIRVMGQNSLLNGNDPLYIIDGVPYGSTSLSSSDIGQGVLGSYDRSRAPGGGLSPFNLLNPADIESITVLKDADATAIYGSRGANGVILITTKKGKAGDTRVDLNISQGSGKITRMMNLLNTPQYLQMRHKAIANDSTTVKPFDYDLNGVWDTTRYTNWQKVLIGNSAQYSNVNLNISGGSANTQFILGGTFNRQTLVIPGDYSDKKAGAFFNLTHQSSNKKFNAQFSANYVFDNSNLPGNDLTGVALNLAPDAPPIYNEDGSLNWQIHNGSSTWQNPLSYTLINAIAKSSNLISNLNLSYLLMPGLQLTGKFGYTSQFMDQRELEPSTTIKPPYNLPINATSLSAINQANSWTIEPQISYDKQIAKGRFSALIGSTFQENESSSSSYYATGFTSDALINYPQSASTFRLLGQENSLYHYNAIYGRFGYTWDDKYLLNLTARRDGSSRFGPGKQFGNFGAVAAAWIFTKEQGMFDNLPWLSFGKLRGSYGITGNDQIGDYQYLSTYSAQGSANEYLGSTTFQPNGLTNPYFSWERVKKLQGELDLGFFKDRIYLASIYYENRDDNQLVGYSLPLITGFSSIQANLPASVQNNGWELTLNTQNIVTGSFRWSSSINLTLPQNKLLAFPDIENTSYATQYAVGKSTFSHFVYHNTGVDPQTGVYTFATNNSNGIPSYPQDLVLSKPVTQSAYGGFNNSFSYKGFQLDIFLQFVKQQAYNYLPYFSAPGRPLQNEPVWVLGAWQQPGDNSSIQQYTTTRVQTPAKTASQYITSSDATISDASFIRCKNIAFSYTFPAAWTKKASFRSLKIYFQAQNLFTITNYKGLDPESGGYGLPPLRMITFGLQANL